MNCINVAVFISATSFFVFLVEAQKGGTFWRQPRFGGFRRHIEQPHNHNKGRGRNEDGRLDQFPGIRGVFTDLPRFGPPSNTDTKPDPRSDSNLVVLNRVVGPDTAISKQNDLRKPKSTTNMWMKRRQKILDRMRKRQAKLDARKQKEASIRAEKQRLEDERRRNSTVKRVKNVEMNNVVKNRESMSNEPNTNLLEIAEPNGLFEINKDSKTENDVSGFSNIADDTLVENTPTRLNTLNTSTQLPTKLIIVNTHTQLNIVNTSTQLNMVTTTQPNTFKTPTQPDTVNTSTQLNTINTHTQLTTVKIPTQLNMVNTPTQLNTENTSTEVNTVNAPTQLNMVNTSTQLNPVNSTQRNKVNSTQPTTFKTTSQLHTINTPTRLTTMSTPTQLNTVNTPTQLNTVNTPTELNAINTPTQLHMVKTSSQLNAINTSTQLNTVNTPKQLHSVNISAQLNTVNTHAKLNTVYTSTQLNTVTTPTRLNTANTPTQLHAINKSTQLNTAKTRTQINTVNTPTQLNAVITSTQLNTVTTATQLNTVNTSTQLDIANTPRQLEMVNASTKLNTLNIPTQQNTVNTTTHLNDANNGSVEKLKVGSTILNSNQNKHVGKSKDVKTGSVLNLDSTGKQDTLSTIENIPFVRPVVPGFTVNDIPVIDLADTRDPWSQLRAAGEGIGMPAFLIPMSDGIFSSNTNVSDIPVEPGTSVPLGHINQTTGVLFGPDIPNSGSEGKSIDRQSGQGEVKEVVPTDSVDIGTNNLNSSSDNRSGEPVSQVGTETGIADIPGGQTDPGTGSPLGTAVTDSQDNDGELWFDPSFGSSQAVVFESVDLNEFLSTGNVKALDTNQVLETQPETMSENGIETVNGELIPVPGQPRAIPSTGSSKTEPSKSTKSPSSSLLGFIFDISRALRPG